MFSEVIKSLREISAWIWGVLVGFAGMVGTAVALWTANVASPSDLHAMEVKIRSEMDVRAARREEQIISLRRDIDRVDKNVSWLVRNAGGRPK